MKISLPVKKLYVYFASKLLVKLISIIGVFSSLIFLVTYVEILRKTKQDNLILFKKVILTAKQIPFIIEQILPLLIVISSVWTIMSLARYSEITIAKGSGISQWKLCSLFGTVAGTVGLFFVMVINPYSTSWIKEYYHWKSHRGTEVTPIEIIVNQDKQKIIITAKDINRLEKKINNISLHYFESKDISNKVIFANNADYDLDNSYIRLFSPEIYISSENNFKVINNKSELEIPIENLNDYLKAKSKTDHIYSIYDIKDKVNIAPDASPIKSLLYTIFYGLLSFPLLCAFMAAITVTLTPQLLRNNDIIRNSALILAICFFIYAMDIILMSFGKNDILMPIFAAFFAKIIAITCTIWLVLKREYGYAS